MYSPSYGFREAPIVDRMFARKNYYINYKKCWNKNEKHFKNEQKVGMLLQKRTDTRGVYRDKYMSVGVKKKLPRSIRTTGAPV